MSGPEMLAIPSDYITLALLFAALGIFSWLAAKSRNIRKFQFQISIFISIYIAGGIVEQLAEKGIITMPPGLSELGFMIHVSSMVFFSLMIWLRYILSKRSGRKMIEEV